MNPRILHSQDLGGDQSYFMLNFVLLYFVVVVVGNNNYYYFVYKCCRL